jgi:RimJ/RimL family protein N-acetyltransferase
MVWVAQQRETWNPPVIEGRSVTLRRPAPGDLAAVRRWYRDPELTHLTRYSLKPMGDEEIDRFFHARLLSPESLAYVIVLRDGERLVGLTTFSNLDPDNDSVLFHITIGERDAWGRGYGTEAAELMLWLAFERIGLHRVALSVFSFNERAVRAYQKAGFRIEGRSREAIVRDGRRWDEVQMAILVHEWRARPERYSGGPGW